MRRVSGTVVESSPGMRELFDDINQRWKGSTTRRL